MAPTALSGTSPVNGRGKRAAWLLSVVGENEKELDGALVRAERLGSRPVPRTP